MKAGVSSWRPRAATGAQGDDITHNARTIKAIPLILEGKDVPDVLEVRGEIYWPKKEFNAYNARRAAAGLELFANPRNATAGTLKQLDPKIAAGRGLSFAAHGIGEVSPLEAKSLSEMITHLARWGVPVLSERRVCANIGEVWAFIEDFRTRRHLLAFEVDGVVVKVDSFDQQAALGPPANTRAGVLPTNTRPSRRRPCWKRWISR